MKPNLRDSAGSDRNFASFNREERNLVAIFFHTLLIGDNLNQFLARADIDLPVVPEEYGIFFEYSYLRDLWATLTNDDDKRRLVLEFSGVKDPARFVDESILSFNQTFGASPNPSASEIQSPSRWSISRYESSFNDDEEFLAVTKFKWSFNIKPDLVIHLSRNSCICIEAKVASGEGEYPNKSQEKEIFRRRDLARVRQTDLQRFMMEELLGYEAIFLYLSPGKAGSSSHRGLSWQEAFDAMETSSLPPFALETLRANNAIDAA